MIEFFEAIFLSVDAFFDSLLVSYGVAGLIAALASLLWVRRLVRKMMRPVGKSARNPRRLQWIAYLSAMTAFVPALYAGLIGGTFFSAVAKAETMLTPFTSIRSLRRQSNRARMTAMQS